MRRTALILALLPTLLSAQGKGRQGPPPPGPPGAKGEARREHVMARLHEIRTRRLQEALGVTPEKARSIADRWGRFDVDSVERRQEGMRLRRQMDEILRGPGTEDEKSAKLAPIVTRMTALREQQQEARGAFEDDVRASLTPAQQGRFILLVEEFQRNLAEALAGRRP